ncbi:unnamed protein product [Arabis nemorensis]|uniref:Pectinesterase catalytic domain-containing protein n=1 Tax=Arabis nemorensis TaxID=586526 RepID=A0A565C084_9BRAS|nr:unnamed protein product [Arabis nemorensis]
MQLSCFRSVIFTLVNQLRRKKSYSRLKTAIDRETLPVGISLIDCRILAAPDLVHEKANFKAYLGRPWRPYSRTILINSFIDDLIDPAGWLEWNKGDRLDKLYYGEYMNKGPGANVTNRVKRPGYRRIKNAAEAAKFTVGPFIKGKAWLNSTFITFTLGVFE